MKMSSLEEVDLWSASGKPHPVESEDSEIEVSLEDDPVGSCDRAYADDEEKSDLYQQVPHRSRNFTDRVKRVQSSVFAIRSFTCIILVASVLALALLLASRIILGKRPYTWRADKMGLVAAVIDTAAITVSTHSSSIFVCRIN